MAGRNLLEEAPSTQAPGKDLLGSQEIPHPYDIKKSINQDLERMRDVGAEQRRGAALPLLGIAQSVPYEPIQKWATEKVKEIKETPPPSSVRGAAISPRTVGEIGAGVGLTMIPGSKLMQGASTLGRALGATTLGGLTGGLLTPSTEQKRIYPEKIEAAKEGAILGGVLQGMGSLAGTVVGKGYNYVKDTLKKAYGGDAKRMADDLRRYATGKTGQEAAAAQRLAQEAEEEAKRLEAGISKQERAAEKAYGGLPTTTKTVEAGKEVAIPSSTQEIGQNIKAQAKTILDRLKDVRSNNAEKLKKDAFSFALNKERAGQTIGETKAYDNLIAEIDRSIKNPDTGLFNQPVESVRNQLMKVKNAVEGTSVNEAGEVVSFPPSFEGLEKLRRYLNDRAYGLPAEGFDAISQQQAGKLAKQVENIMSEFSNGKINKFIDQYKKDSDPLRIFQTKIGKALTGEQIPGATGYAATAAADVPGRVFKNKDSFDALIDAFGGNRKFAEQEAKKYFVSQLESRAGDPKAIRNFIRDNRSMLKETKSMAIAEKYLQKVESATTEAGRLKEQLKPVQKTIAEKKAVADKYNFMQMNVMAARTPQEVANTYNAFAESLKRDGLVNEYQYKQMLDAAENVRLSARATEEARTKVMYTTTRILGAGLAGGAAYFGLKGLGSE